MAASHQRSRDGGGAHGLNGGVLEGKDGGRKRKREFRRKLEGRERRIRVRRKCAERIVDLTRAIGLESFGETIEVRAMIDEMKMRGVKRRKMEWPCVGLAFQVRRSHDYATTGFTWPLLTSWLHSVI